jgi:predicted DNA-binding protein with PD1-like motif
MFRSGPQPVQFVISAASAACRRLSKGCIVRMTCELVIMKHSDYEFDRALDPVTGYDELVVSRRQM